MCTDNLRPPDPNKEQPIELKVIGIERERQNGHFAVFCRSLDVNDLELNGLLFAGPVLGSPAHRWQEAAPAHGGGAATHGQREWVVYQLSLCE